MAKATANALVDVLAQVRAASEEEARQTLSRWVKSRVGGGDSLQRIASVESV